MKCQFCIRFENIDMNSAASKAVADCNVLFARHGYKDYTFTVGDNSNRKKYYLKLFAEMVRFFLGIRINAVVGIQYPLLSINNVFRHFIRIAKLKGARFFCIVHDLESLRNGGMNEQQVKQEIRNLGAYDVIIVHNDKMMDWLRSKGLAKPMVPLGLFDYLVDRPQPEIDQLPWNRNEIAFAGNLGKSGFIYRLNELQPCLFNLYGPNFREQEVTNKNLQWMGEFDPTTIVSVLKGKFGLIWDGNDIDRYDEQLGNYLKYNNPHKASLYIAAGLPIIAHESAAIAPLIKRLNIGVLISSLHQLKELKLDSETYQEMRLNCLILRKQVVNGDFFGRAIASAERNSYVA